MNKLLATFVIFAIIVVVAGEEKYTTKYDNINIDEILNNKRLLRGYSNCLLEKAACSPDGAELKKVLPDAIETNCEKCSERQRDASRTILRHLINKEPAIWNELEEKYDPQATYRRKYKEEAAKQGIHFDV
uniref:CSP2 n=1 Tax=Holotrichia parallela TaxID=93412 RepID=A0A0G2YDC1_HOLPA|nr:CSP2 [Holotrichia parallela]